MTNFALEERGLAIYLEANITGFRGPLRARRFSGGQSNPTWLLEAASGRYVLRSKPAGALLRSAHAVDREFRVIQALAGSEVPVARAYHLCEDESVIGAVFYVMSFEEGRIFWDAALPEVTAEQRPALYDAINQTLAALHKVDIQAVGLADFGKPGNYFERQIARWEQQYRAAQTGPIESMETLIRWLKTNLPPDDGHSCLIHGDFRIDNLIFHPAQPRVIAVLDWELATLGHPMADLAYYCMWLRLPALGATRGLAGKDQRALNIPSEQELIENYCARTAITSIDFWPFYLAFSFFKMAAIVQRILKRALEGNATNNSALEAGKMAPLLSDMGVALLR